MKIHHLMIIMKVWVFKIKYYYFFIIFKNFDFLNYIYFRLIANVHHYPINLQLIKFLINLLIYCIIHFF